MLTAIGATWVLGSLGDLYAAWALVLHPGSLPGGEVVVAVNSAMWLPPILLMGVFLILLFPDGHLPSRALAHPSVGDPGGRRPRSAGHRPVPGPDRGRGDPGEGEPDRRRGTRGPGGRHARGHPSADPVGRARGSRRQRPQVSPGEWRCPSPDEVADGCGRAGRRALRDDHGDVDDEPVPDARRLRQRGADVLPDGVDHLLRTDPHRHRDRDHPAQALRHRRADQPRTGGRGARRVRHRAVRRHRRRRRRVDRATPAVGLALGPGDRPGGGAVPAGAGARAPAGQPARLRVAGHAVRGALRLLGQHGRALHHRRAAPADGADGLRVPRRRPRGGLAARAAQEMARDVVVAAPRPRTSPTVPCRASRWSASLCRRLPPTGSSRSATARSCSACSW